MNRLRRLTIGGIMWMTLVVSVGLAALRNPSETWAGVLLLMTLGVLACTWIAAFCRPAAERPWWLGFSLFGSGYMWLALWSERHDRLPSLPTTAVLTALAPLFHAEPFRTIGGPFGVIGGGIGGFAPPPPGLYMYVGQCLLTLLVATFGGIVTLLVSTLGRGRTNGEKVTAARDDQPPLKWWRRPAARVFAGTVWLVLFTLVGYPRNPELFAGTLYLLTYGLVGTAILGALLGKGRRRTEWVGAALFGGCYLVLHLSDVPEAPPWSSYRPAEYVLSVLRPALISSVKTLHGTLLINDADNHRIRQKLELRIPLKFSTETPLEEVLDYIKRATREPGDRGIRVYVDPVGLQEAEKTMLSPVQIDIEGLPLRATLPLVLKQLGMTYYVRDGLLIITSESSDDLPINAPDDPYYLAGHCILTWLAAAFGALIAPRVAAVRREAVA